MKKKILKTIIFVVFAIWLSLAIYFVIGNFDVKEVVEEKVKEEVPIVSEATLIAAGDALIHSGVYLVAKTGSTYDFKPMLALVKEVVEPYDLAFYNQETILGGTELGLSTYPRFNSPQEVGDDMIDAGFNLVSRANNHTLDRGEAAILAAEEYWKTKPDILTAGSYISEEDRTEVKIKTVNDINIAFLAYTTLTNGLSAPAGKEFYVNKYDKDKVKEDVERIGDSADIIIVSMHWGVEYTHTPTKEEYDIAEYLSTLGVDIVLGQHPHVVQPVQYVGDTLVAYSMGNLISAQDELMQTIGLLVSLKITKTTFKGETTIEISDVLGTLLYNPDRSPKGRFIIYPFDKVDETILKNYESVYEKYSNYVKVDETIEIRGLE